jgi:hypothetical protein
LKVEERRLFDEAGRALANMCVQSAHLWRKVVDNRGINALVDCLESSSGQTMYGVGALSGIASDSDKDKTALIETGCLKFVSYSTVLHTLQRYRSA